MVISEKSVNPPNEDVPGKFPAMKLGFGVVCSPPPIELACPRKYPCLWCCHQPVGAKKSMDFHCTSLTHPGTSGFPVRSILRENETGWGDAGPQDPRMQI